MRVEERFKKRFGDLAEQGERLWMADSWYYAEANAWLLSALQLVSTCFGEDSRYFKWLDESRDTVARIATEREQEAFQMCLTLFRAARDDYEYGMASSFRSLVKAEASMDALDQATELLDTGYKDPAAVIVGCALEVGLRELWKRHHTGDPPKANQMSQDLRKAGAYNLTMEKQVAAWLDLRNNAAHGHWDQYDDKLVRAMIDGVANFIADYLR